MNIDKEKLKEAFKKNDFDYVFTEAKKITDFLLVHKFKVTDDDDRQDWCGECLANLWLKIIQKKVKADQNIFSFIWQNSTFRILEIIRKNRNRAKKIQFISYDKNWEVENFSNFVDYRVNRFIDWQKDC